MQNFIFFTFGKKSELLKHFPITHQVLISRSQAESQEEPFTEKFISQKFHSLRKFQHPVQHTHTYTHIINVISTKILGIFGILAFFSKSESSL